jgi:preprotein translocase subunit SecD
MATATCIAFAVWAFTMSVSSPVSAQSQPPAPQDCVSFHEVHAELSAANLTRDAVPAGYRLYPYVEGIGDAPLLLREEPLLRAGDMVEAQSSLDQHTGQPVVSFRFGAEGTRKFAEFTRDNIGRPLAIVVDGSVISAPIVQTPILGGVGQISGNLSAEDARQLADRIASGKCG